MVVYRRRRRRFRAVFLPTCGSITFHFYARVCAWLASLLRRVVRFLDAMPMGKGRVADFSRSLGVGFRLVAKPAFPFGDSLTRFAPQQVGLDPRNHRSACACIWLQDLQFGLYSGYFLWLASMVLLALAGGCFAFMANPKAVPNTSAHPSPPKLPDRIPSRPVQSSPDRRSLSPKRFVPPPLKAFTLPHSSRHVPPLPQPDRSPRPRGRRRPRRPAQGRRRPRRRRPCPPRLP